MIHSGEKNTVTVLLAARGGDRKVRPFYCCACGKCVCEVVGSARMLVPGVPEGEELGLRSVVVQCRGFLFTDSGEKLRCDARYLF